MDVVRVSLGLFLISIGLHLFLQSRIAECRHKKSSTLGFGYLVDVTWPYALSEVIVRFGLPQVVAWLGFGPLGVMANSFAAWIQTRYGISSIFSLLQSIGATGRVPHPKSMVAGSTGIMSGLKQFFSTATKDPVQECVEYYESWLIILNLTDLFLVLVLTMCWYFRDRRQ